MGTPSYLPLLNSIAVNEKKGEQFLNAWADTTCDEQLATVLRFVAIREGEHAWAFTKRMCELGYEVCEEDAFQVFSDFDAVMECVCSDAPDAEKVAFITGMLGGGGEGDGGRDPFSGFFNDTTIDPETGALLGRYIAEERDSGRRLQAEYDRVCSAGSRITESELDELKVRIKALQKEIKALKRLHAA
jgi:hypothetical protein